jgi:hypothetical protein
MPQSDSLRVLPYIIAMHGRGGLKLIYAEIKIAGVGCICNLPVMV